MDHCDLKNYILKFPKNRRARSRGVRFKYNELKDQIGDEMREYVDDPIYKNLIIMKMDNETKAEEEKVKNITQSPSLFEFEDIFEDDEKTKNARKGTKFRLSNINMILMAFKNLSHRRVGKMKWMLYMAKQTLNEDNHTFILVLLNFNKFFLLKKEVKGIVL
jgi:hypothetical protein